ncbi:hypothetical protein LIER_24297 [Lithospermum erythrorhizon]|uniref:Uncharacterized protein n=1 Tax=Lithospermum erythrorhizon TaxID=34254 RepID=A0AAV3R3T5_LITER
MDKKQNGSYSTNPQLRKPQHQDYQGHKSKVESTNKKHTYLKRRSLTDSRRILGNFGSFWRFWRVWGFERKSVEEESTTYDRNHTFYRRGKRCDVNTCQGRGFRHPCPKPTSDEKVSSQKIHMWNQKLHQEWVEGDPKGVPRLATIT